MEENKEVVLTYETLYEILRREKSRDELQQLEPAFLRDALNYLKEKQQAYDDNLAKNDIFSQSERDKLHIQITNIKKILKDLYDIRERKIINMSINKSRTNSHIIDAANLMAPEQGLFEGVTTVLNLHRTGIINKILEQREPDIMPAALPLPEETKVEVNEDTKKVKFIEKTDQFAGPELELYGPYNAEDEADLPPEVAEILINQGKATEIQ
jgi:DNA replication initiation complex subunit (GINS family)